MLRNLEVACSLSRLPPNTPHPMVRVADYGLSGSPLNRFFGFKLDM